MKIIKLLLAYLFITLVSNCAQAVQFNNDKERTLTVVFSRADENVDVGIVEIGNTRRVADAIQALVHTDMFQLKTKDPYPFSYKECVERVKYEQETNARPELVSDVDISNYHTIFLGYPIWLHDMPMPMYTFLEKHDFSGKTIIPFVTYLSTGPLDTVDKLKKMFPKANILPAFAIPGSETQNNTKLLFKKLNDYLSEHDPDLLSF